MRITSKGKLTISKSVLTRAGLTPGSQVDILVDDGVVEIRRANVCKEDTIDKRIAAFSGTGNRKHSTAELMALLRGE